MKLIVCDSCEAEFQIKHTMDEKFYILAHCPFCGGELSEELEDEMMWDDDE